VSVLFVIGATAGVLLIKNKLIKTSDDDTTATTSEINDATTNEAGLAESNADSGTPDSGTPGSDAADSGTDLGSENSHVSVDAAGNLTINTNTVETAKSEPVSLLVSSMGDCTLGTDKNFSYSSSVNAYYSKNGAAYFFQNVKPILEADDLSIVNMEGTLTTSNTRMDKTFAFKGDAEFANILVEGSVEAANLANNHSKDYGEVSYTDTIAALDAAGIVNFGYDRIAVMEIKGIKVGLCGIYELGSGMGCATQLKTNIALLKQQGAQLIIVNFHWGIEREYSPNSTQTSLAHIAVDEGANLVIGHHPHVLQSIEKYNGVYICYSMGNFCFGGNSNPSDKDTMIFQQTFHFDENQELVPSDEINIIPCRVSAHTGYNDYCPTPVDGADAERVLGKLKRIGW
jgi:poly-gamma-glutamate synthesis protein (capsule biosynthesis protein)